MSYSIQLYRKEVKEKYLQSKDNTFFKKKENLIPFTEKQIEDLIQRLLNYGYSIESKGEHGYVLNLKMMMELRFYLVVRDYIFHQQVQVYLK